LDFARFDLLLDAAVLARELAGECDFAVVLGLELVVDLTGFFTVEVFALEVLTLAAFAVAGFLEEVWVEESICAIAWLSKRQMQIADADIAPSHRLAVFTER
jgi:hypothetical protein